MKINFSIVLNTIKKVSAEITSRYGKGKLNVCPAYRGESFPEKINDVNLKNAIDEYNSRYTKDVLSKDPKVPKMRK